MVLCRNDYCMGTDSFTAQDWKAYRLRHLQLGIKVQRLENQIFELSISSFRPSEGHSYEKERIENLKNFHNVHKLCRKDSNFFIPS